MSYEVLIRRRAAKQLVDLSPRDYERVKSAISDLGENPRPQGCLKLTVRPGWRIRIADYRVIFEVDDRLRTVPVLDVGNRRDIYR